MNNELPMISTATVKVMRSYDYCHFEVTLSTTETPTLNQVDELRKEAARLADKAVLQYQTAKSAASRRDSLREPWRLTHAQSTPENERTPTEKAIIKYHADAAFASRFDYDYQDDWSSDNDEDEDM